MKILCDNCGAKYSIADEKVAGRVFKIRCKKCTNIIAVRGDQVAAPAEEQAPAAFDYGSDQVWHVVVDGDQQGPFAPAQLGGMLTDGTIDWEAYVWKEGFDGWKPARDVPELVAAITGEAPADAGGAAADDDDRTMVGDPNAMGADPFGGGSADPFAGAETSADPFGAADPFGGAPAAADPFAGSSDPFGGGGGGGGGFGGGGGAFGGGAADAGPDLFGAGSADAGFGGDDDVVASAPSPRVGADQAMTGQRNENSVLFSLSNLQALATGSSGGDSPSAPGPISSAPAGHATGEGSGLIDIRALASATAATSGSSGGSSSSGGVDDLLSIGGGGGLGPALGAPVLAPAAAEPEGGNKGLLIGAIVGGVAVLGLLVALVVVLMDRPAEQVAANAPVAAGTPAAVEGTPAPAAPAAATPATPAEPATTTMDEGSNDDEAEDDETEDDGNGGTRRRPRGTSRMSSSTSSPAAMDDPPPSMTSMSSSSSDIDDLLAGALGGSSMMAAAMESAAASNLPAQPGRDDVAGALRSVSTRVQGCGNGTAGVAQAAIVFANSGRVRSVNVTGVPPAVQSCVARTVRSARVPPFQRSTFNVNYPFRVR